MCSQTCFYVYSSQGEATARVVFLGGIHGRIAETHVLGSHQPCIGDECVLLICSLND